MKAIFTIYSIDQVIDIPKAHDIYKLAIAPKLTAAIKITDIDPGSIIPDGIVEFRLEKIINGVAFYKPNVETKN